MRNPAKGVGPTPRLGSEDVGRLARRRKSDDRTVLSSEVPDGMSRSSGLARTGWPDYRHQRRGPGHCRRSGRLRIIDGRRDTVGAALSPPLQRQLLAEDRLGGETPVGDVLNDRSPVPASRQCVRPFRAEPDASSLR